MLKGRLFSVRRALVFLGACAATFALEHWAEAVFVGDEVPLASESLFSARGAYGYLVTSFPRPLVPRFTALVKLDPGSDLTQIPPKYRICDQRDYLSRLLPALAGHEPSVIVIDKYFSAGLCASGDPGTKALKASIAAVSSRIPVIVGLRIMQKSDATHEGFPVYRLHTEPLDLPESPNLYRGIINVERDSRLAPLRWMVGQKSAVPALTNTVGLQAAIAEQPRLLEINPLLDELARRGVHPFVSLMPGAKFQWSSAGEVLCSSTTLDERSKAVCGPSAGIPRDLGLRGRVVLLGESEDEHDIHRTVIGTVPGLVLQANYVEALLDGRYFKPAPTWVNYALGFLFFLAVEWALSRPAWWVCVVWVGGSIGVMFVLLVLAARHAGYLINPITLSAFVLVLNVAFWLRDRLTHREEAHAKG